ncbi:MAG: hypothetical protein JSS57_04385 [Proteobacteria bacterium]|nr:hypothetical protein [Pseudomonadota bacterium]
MKIPVELAADVRRFVQDFDRVTAAWIANGEYQADEVAEWRQIIRLDMQSEKGANSAIDPRPQAERIKAWCKTWRELRAGLDKRGL